MQDIIQRLDAKREAAKLGFAQAWAPARLKTQGDAGIAIRQVADLNAFLQKCFGEID